MCPHFPTLLTSTKYMAAALTTTAILATSSSHATSTSQATLADVSKSARSIQSDGANRIDLAGRLGMLTQWVAAASCMMTSGIEVEQNHANLEHAVKEFERIVNALQHGDVDLGIDGPEQRRITLVDIEHIWEEWRPTREAIDAVLADGHDKASAEIIDDHNLKLLELARILASDVNGQYSHPHELSQANVMMIGIVGNERMLTQKMAKESCEIWSGFHADQARTDLQASMKVFEASLLALLNGLPDAGVAPAPTPGIKAHLDAILERWQVIKKHQLKLISGEALEASAKVELIRDINFELKEFDVLVRDYTEYAERHH